VLKLNLSKNLSECSMLCAAVGALLLFTGSRARSQSIVKWVDAQGQTHYSDHAPTGQETKVVSVHVSRPGVAAAPAESAAAREAEQRRRAAEQQAAVEEAKAKADEDVVAKCKRSRDVDCNEGADAIRQHEKTLAEIQYADAITARQERVSRGLPPGPMPQPPL
jgi:hypothetical protein